MRKEKTSILPYQIFNTSNSNIPIPPKYGVYILQLIARACSCINTVYNVFGGTYLLSLGFLKNLMSLKVFQKI